MKGIAFLTGLWCMILLMFVSQTLYEYNAKDNVTFDIYNYTETNLAWNYTTNEDVIKGNLSQSGYNIDKIQSVRINNIITKTIDWIGYTIYEVTKWSVEFGYTHPEYNFKFYMNFVLCCVVVMVFIQFFPYIIIILALLYLAINGIIKLFKYIKRKRKENKDKNIQ